MTFFGFGASPIPFWQSFMKEKTFLIQYLPVEREFLLSSEDTDTLSYWKMWTRYSIHSEMGIFLESNTVPVSGLNFLPQPRHL